MDNKLQDFFISLLKKEVIPAVGCTEPIAVAFATAKAKEVLGVKPDKVELILSGNVIKNAMGVGIPGTKKKGLQIATALGVLAGNAQAKLEVLKKIDEYDIKDATNYIDEKRVTIKKYENDEEKLYIEARCFYEDQYSKVIIRGSHTNITLIEKNNNIILDNQEEKISEKEKEFSFQDANDITFQNIFEFSTQAPLSKIEFIINGADMNKKIALEGLTNKYGLGIGKCLKDKMEKNIICDDLNNFVVAFTTAATDARMSGSNMPVMSNSGSGNQGLTVMLPVIATVEKLNLEHEKLIRALILSNLIAIYIKVYLGRLSALCGAIVAGTGAAAAITWLLGGNFNQVKSAVKNMIGNITGMICDGAKEGCSLKVASCASCAVQSAQFALSDIAISSEDGIIEEDIDKTIKNLAYIGSLGMKETDDLILQMMLNK